MQLDETRFLEKSDYGEFIRMYREIKGGWTYKDMNDDTLIWSTKTMPLGIDLNNSTREEIKKYKFRGKKQKQFVMLFLDFKEKEYENLIGNWTMKGEGKYQKHD